MQDGENNMSKETTYTRDTNKPFDDSDIDYSAIDNITNEEIQEGAISDPDAQPQTKEQLSKFKRVKPKKGNT